MPCSAGTRGAQRNARAARLRRVPHRVQRHDGAGGAPALPRPRAASSAGRGRAPPQHRAGRERTIRRLTGQRSPRQAPGRPLEPERACLAELGDRAAWAARARRVAASHHLEQAARPPCRRPPPPNRRRRPGARSPPPPGCVRRTEDRRRRPRRSPAAPTPCGSPRGNRAAARFRCRGGRSCCRAAGRARAPAGARRDVVRPASNQHMEPAPMPPSTMPLSTPRAGSRRRRGRGRRAG